ncbi:MAG: hypothetical protein LEGION0398_MBIBDBAK_00331 [Legionellaceae bacterium]
MDNETAIKNTQNLGIVVSLPNQNFSITDVLKNLPKDIPAATVDLDKDFLNKKDASIEDNIKNAIEILQLKKSGSNKISIEVNEKVVKEYIYNPHKEKRDINPKDSYFQRALTYAGAACSLINIRYPNDEFNNETIKKTAKKKIKELILKEKEKIDNLNFDDPKQANVVDNMGSFLGKISEILGETLTDKSNKGIKIGEKTAAKWLADFEPVYVASNIGAKDHITELKTKNGGKTYFQVTEYKKALNEKLKSEYRGYQEKQWYKALPKPIQWFIEDMVTNEKLDSLQFIPATADKIPGLRNARETKLFFKDNQDFELLSSIHNSSSKIPNGISGTKKKNIKEKERSSKINAEAFRETYPADKKVRLINLLSRVSFLEKTVAWIEQFTGRKLPLLGGSNNNTTMIEMQEKAFGNEVEHINIPVNLWGYFTQEKWEGWFKNLRDTIISFFKSTPDEHDNSQSENNSENEEFSNNLVTDSEKLNTIDFLKQQIAYIDKHPLTGVNPQLFKAAYEVLLGQEEGVTVDTNCKSGKDRTGIVNAIVETLRIIEKEEGEIPEYEELAKENSEIGEKFGELFAEMYFAHALSAGVNSPGSDDLKLSEVPLPDMIKNPLKEEYSFTHFKLGKLNKPKAIFEEPQEKNNKAEDKEQNNSSKPDIKLPDIKFIEETTKNEVTAKNKVTGKTLLTVVAESTQEEVVKSTQSLDNSQKMHQQRIME